MNTIDPNLTITDIQSTDSETVFSVTQNVPVTTQIDVVSIQQQIDAFQAQIDNLQAILDSVTNVAQTMGVNLKIGVKTSIASQ